MEHKELIINSLQDACECEKVCFVTYESEKNLCIYCSNIESGQLVNKLQETLKEQKINTNIVNPKSFCFEKEQPYSSK